MSIAPDMAIMSFGVLKEAKTAREALDQNNKAMSDIFKAMKENGIEDKDMQTSGFSIQPGPEWLGCELFLHSANRL